MMETIVHCKACAVETPIHYMVAGYTYCQACSLFLEQAHAAWQEARAEWEKAHSAWEKADAEWEKANADREAAYAAWKKTEAERKKLR